MSLTNPDKVVTEERLSEFYQAILPYLGGMPTAIANKFSRADLYSTSEKIVGCWTDGKPIYQKTIVDTVPNVTTGGTNAVKNVSVGASVDRFVSIDGIIYGASGDAAKVAYNVTNPESNVVSNKVYYVKCIGRINGHSENPNTVAIISNTTTFNAGVVYVTVKYTKTTDSANSFKFSSETDYSTTEHIVGTWIDGKPLYQKTVSFGAMPNNTIKSVAHGISNLKFAVSITGFCYNSNYSKLNPLPYSHKLDASNACLRADNSNIEIETGADWRAYTAYVTLQYTKTTD